MMSIDMSNIKSYPFGKTWPFAVWAGVLILAVTVWETTHSWQPSGLSIYQIFPIFGLVAFSSMWVQYAAVCVAQYYGLKFDYFNVFYKVSGWTVLVAIVMHPGLLSYQLWRDGFGLPPGSVLQHYVAPELGWVALLGVVSLLIFLAYEFYRLFGNKPWWRLELWASELAMVAIFYHALRLGGETQIEWFRVIWFFYGITLVAMLGCIHWMNYAKGHDKGSWRVAGLIVGFVVVASGLLAIGSALAL
jgi:hypothetical protein